MFKILQMRSPTVIEFAETTISLEFQQNEKLISEDLFQKNILLNAHVGSD